MYKAIFFDVDDTLCDRKAVIGKCLTATWNLVRHIYPSLFTKQDFIATYNKFSGQYLPRQDCFRFTLLAKGISNEGLVVNLASTYASILEKDLRLFNGTKEVLRILAERHKLGVISNAPSESQRYKLRTLGIEHFFNVIVISSEVGFKKPSPEIFEIALKLTGITPSEAIYVGNDEDIDIAGAKKAGMVAVWANMHFRSYLGNATPDFEISMMYQLVDLFGSSPK